MFIDWPLRNLTPNTCYRYQVAQSVEQAEGRFCTAASSTDADVTMAVLGNSAADDEVTATLIQAIRGAEPHAILHLGNLQRYSDPNETWARGSIAGDFLLNTAQILPVVGESEFERPASQAGDNADTAREYAEYFAPLWRGIHTRSSGTTTPSESALSSTSLSTPLVRWACDLERSRASLA